MTKILFVCLGNICRSPMAEMILRDMVRREYGAHPRVKRVEGGFDPGITDLVLREF